MEPETQNVGPENQVDTPASISRTDEPECAKYVNTLDMTVQIGTLKTWVSELAALSDECKVKIDPVDGLSVRLVDPAHIAMIDSRLAIEIFDLWHVEPTNAYVGEFGLDLDKLKTYLKGFKAKDSEIELRLHVDMVSRKMTLEGPNGSRVLSLIDECGMSDPKIPVLNLPVELVIKDANAFRQALKGAGEVSDHITLRYESESKTFSLECVGDMDMMTATLEVDVLRSEASTVQKTIDGEMQHVQTFDARSVFSLEYLTNLAKGLPDGFKIELGNDYPIKLAYGQTVKLLAPRIESE